MFPEVGCLNASGASFIIFYSLTLYLFGLRCFLFLLNRWKFPFLATCAAVANVDCCNIRSVFGTNLRYLDGGIQLRAPRLVPYKILAEILRWRRINTGLHTTFLDSGLFQHGYLEEYMGHGRSIHKIPLMSANLSIIRVIFN